MFKLTLSICKLFRTKSIKKFSSLSDKDFFVGLAKHKIDNSQENDDTNYSKLIHRINEVDNYNAENNFEEDYVKSEVIDNCIDEPNKPTIQEKVIHVEQEKPDIVKSLKDAIANIPLEELSNIPSNISNVGPIINKNETMMNFLKMGVDLFKLENMKGGDNILVRLRWEEDVVPVISFLKEQADFSEKQLAAIFSYYPKIFRRPYAEVKELFDYFKSRDISVVDIASMVSSRPNILAQISHDVCKKLTEVESMIDLSIGEMNKILVQHPKIVVEPPMKLKTTLVQLRKIMGFTRQETKGIILTCPRIFIRDKEVVSTNYVFLHRTLNMDYADIVKNAEALVVTPSMLEERVKYLIFLKRYQPDPTKELYTPISAIIDGVDGDFCNKVAHTSTNSFRKFMKTL